MKKLIKRFIENLGFASKEELENLQDEHKTLTRHYADYIKRVEDLEIADEVFQDCVELNHKVKKLEEYLKIKYVVEPSSKLFVGYKKNDTR